MCEESGSLHTATSDVLSSACSAMRRTGAVTFNGQKLNKRFKRQIGFVMQVTQSCIDLCIYVVLCLSQCSLTQIFWTASDMAPDLALFCTTGSAVL